MEELILSRQIAASGTSLFQLLQPLLWFLEQAPHSHNCLIIVPSINSLSQWTNNDWTTALCKARCLLYIYCEVLLSNQEVSWLLESKRHGLRFPFSLTTNSAFHGPGHMAGTWQVPGWLWKSHKREIQWKYKFLDLILCYTILVV